LSAFRGVWLVTMLGLGWMAGSARAEDFEAGKSAAKIFESDCVTCHRSPRGLAKGMGSRALIDFLREHYTTGLGPANELANYLQSGTTDGDDRRAPRQAGEPPRSGDQRQRAQTAGAPPDADTDQPGLPVRKHRRAGSTAEPEATAERDAAAPAHKRHHARSSEPTNEAPPSANAQPSTPSDVQAPSDETPRSGLPTRESRHKHQRSPKGGEPSQAAKQQPEMTPTSPGGGPVGGASGPTQPGRGPGREPAAAAGHGEEPDRSPNAPVHANREVPADAASQSGSTTGSVPSVGLHTSETGGAQTQHEPPSSASGSGDQPAFSAPSP
jgi:hypothetical protein